MNKIFEKKNVQKYYLKTEKLEVNNMDKRLNNKYSLQKTLERKKINIRKGIKFGNKFWKRKLWSKFQKNKNIGDKLFFEQFGDKLCKGKISGQNF